MKQEFRTAFVATIPVLTGYLVLGIGFGILLQAKGYGALWAFGMSVTMYAGAMQYLAVDLLAEGVSLLAAAVATLTVNARHLFYGLSMITRYEGAGRVKPYLIFALTDETYSLLSSGEQRSARYYFYVSALNHSYWITGCVLGVLIGSWLPFDLEGVDFALNALFVSLFTEHWCSTKEHLPMWIGIGATLLCLLVFGSESFLIPALLLIGALLLALRKRMEGGAL